MAYLSELKICRRCQQMKPILCFHRRKEKYFSTCSPCVKLLNAEEVAKIPRAFKKQDSSLLVVQVGDGFSVLGPYQRGNIKFRTLSDAYSFARGKWPDKEIIVRLKEG